MSGASENVVIAEPVILNLSSENSKTNFPVENQMKMNVQVERAVSPSKSQPPQKPVRTKNRNKNINVLADQLNFSKYKIKVEEGKAVAMDTKSEQSEQCPRPRSSTLPDQSSNPPTTSLGQLSKGTSRESEIEEWKPLPSNIESEPKVEKKRGSKGKFKMFKKALSMDRGIETVGLDPNPTGQHPQTSKDNHSNFPKVKKPLSLKSFTSLFNRRKKKKGQFVIEDVENASKSGNSLGRNEPTHLLSNGKQKHWASCHSLETMNSPIHHQAIVKQDTETNSAHQEIQPMGKLLKINPDGTQMVKLIKPEIGPMGFFIAKGSAKFGNGIFVSRFTEARSEQSFAGLLGIGDEIIEVNNHVVRDLSQDAVYNLMSDKSVLLVKVFPFIARKDV